MGESKKRKMEYEEEEDEEEKIERFFTLIKSTRQVCQMLRSSSNWPLEKKDQNKKKEDDRENSMAGAWNPAFQPEDFLDQDNKAASADHGAGPSRVQEEEEEEKKEEDKGGDGLDLKLSL